MHISRRMVVCLACAPFLVAVRRLSCVSSSGGSPQWNQHWHKIEIIRKVNPPAAVDSMGAEALAKRANPTDAQFRFQTLIATMLSPQTRDQQTDLAFNNLQQLLHPKPFLPSSLMSFDVSRIESAIQPVSFYRTKAVNIVEASRKCVQLYNDDIPRNIHDLLAFKGVGPKIAYLTFTIAYNETLGICVDTHVHRIANRLGWTTTTTPEKTRLALQTLLPKEKWPLVNGLLVGFGQTICSAKAPQCSKCSLSDSCKYFQSL